MSTPPKTNMEPENTILDKEKHQPKPPILGIQPLIFRGLHYVVFLYKLHTLHILSENLSKDSPAFQRKNKTGGWVLSPHFWGDRSFFGRWVSAIYKVW